jgi:hypothetical protein
MIKMFTPLTSETKIEKQEEQVLHLPDFEEPSIACVQSILNFSKSLEIKPSKLLNDSFELIKS